MSEIRELTCSDGHVLYYHTWIPEGGQVKAVVHLLHGMAEHSQRYDRFARYLNKQDIAVYAQDHRGHGLTATKAQETLGWFAERDGWLRVAQDSLELSNVIVSDFPKKPLFLMGHSMGSFLARTIIVDAPDLYDGVIMMGTGPALGILGTLGRKLAQSHVRKFGSKFVDEQLNKMSFGSYNKKIPQVHSAFDWLSRDAAEVKKYDDDPLCGFVCTAKFFDDMLDGIGYANSLVRAKKLHNDLPILIISGSMDPVGGYGKGVQKVQELYKAAAMEDLTLHLVEDARHELLNETDRDSTMEYLSLWIQERI
ncbi:alpha/beta hydrolase [Sphaerochaeta sp. PS]|uniref:alpha/beta hydrolase n=1 Tax=Sphaerochaeta sp. PS TaxID=3076336 RepID=UPI0028A4F3A2|nr:alpha/beta hydrolase [Sphaerochaeta sp. PS]MDT4760984.1 lysophospholipase [Sphaerochaeta sp. PS]